MVRVPHHDIREFIIVQSGCLCVYCFSPRALELLMFTHSAHSRMTREYSPMLEEHLCALFLYTLCALCAFSAFSVVNFLSLILTVFFSN
jgi:hypothetical protein